MKASHGKTGIAMIFMLLLITSGCNTPAEKMKGARKDMVASGYAQTIGSQAFEADLKRYRLAAATLFATNDSLMTEFKISLKNAYKETNPYYKGQIEDLELQSAEMKKKIKDYNGLDNKEWVAFKKTFSRDMSELLAAYNSLSVKITGPHNSRVY